MLRRAFTLLEMVVVTAIFTVVVLILYGMIEVGGRVNRDVAVEADVTDLASRILKEMQDRMVTARVPYVAVTDYTSSTAPYNDQFVRFREPVDHDGDGDTTDGNGAAEYGVRVSRTNQLLNGALEFHWVRTATVVESATGLDINRDGDTNDSYAAGQMELRHFNSAGTEIAGSRVVLGGTGRVRFLWNHSTTSPAPTNRRLDPIFSQPPTTGTPPPDFRELGTAPPLVGIVAAPPAQGVLINLTVMHEPIPGPRGPELHVFTLRSRATSRLN